MFCDETTQVLETGIRLWHTLKGHKSILKFPHIFWIPFPNYWIFVTLEDTERHCWKIINIVTSCSEWGVRQVRVPSVWEGSVLSQFRPHFLMRPDGSWWLVRKVNRIHSDTHLNGRTHNTCGWKPQDVEEKQTIHFTRLNLFCCCVKLQIRLATSPQQACLCPPPQTNPMVEPMWWRGNEAD